MDDSTKIKTNCCLFISLLNRCRTLRDTLISFYLCNFIDRLYNNVESIVNYLNKYQWMTLPKLKQLLLIYEFIQ